MASSTVLTHTAMRPVRLLSLSIILALAFGSEIVAQSVPEETTGKQATAGQIIYRSVSRSAEDSTRSVFNFKAAPLYVRSTPFSIYTGAGNPQGSYCAEYRTGQIIQCN